jgi:hypothetical protein
MPLGPKWTPEADARLTELADIFAAKRPSHVRWRVIGEAMQRSGAACQLRFARLLRSHTCPTCGHRAVPQ